MKILFCLSARLGDVICGIPAYLALREKYKDADLSWLTLPQYVSLIPKCGKTIPFGSPPYGGIPPWAKPPEYDIVIKAQPMWRHTEWEKSRLHIIDLISKWSGVTPRKKRIYIDTTPEDIEHAQKITPKQPFITICSSPCYSSANWPHEERTTIARTLIKKGIPIVTVGGPDGKEIPGTISAHGKLPYTQTIALINLSKLYIGPDTGATWLACAARNAKKVCLIDRNRLKQGMTGYQTILTEKNITDIYYQDGIKKHIDIINNQWNS